MSLKEGTLTLTGIGFGVVFSSKGRDGYLPLRIGECYFDAAGHSEVLVAPTIGVNRISGGGRKTKGLAGGETPE